MKYEGKSSSVINIRCGVPQVSVLGPLLFLILIGDIDQNVASAFLSSFADDTRVQRGVMSDQDCSDLQADLNVIYNWAEGVNMHFNADKFEYLRLKFEDLI